MRQLYILTANNLDSDFLFNILSNLMTESFIERTTTSSHCQTDLELLVGSKTLPKKLKSYFISLLHGLQNMDKKWHIDIANQIQKLDDGFIDTRFQNARLYHIVRDGRDVVHSWLNRGQYFSSDLIPHLTADNIENDPYQAKWASMNALQKNTWKWTTHLHLIELQKPSMTFYYEGFVEEPYRELHRLLESLDNTSPNTSKTKGSLKPVSDSMQVDHFPNWNDWPQAWKDQFWEIAGPTMERHGYQRDSYGKPSTKMQED